VLEEVLGYDGADRVTAPVLGARGATPVAIEAREGIGTALLEIPTENVAFAHRTSMSEPAWHISPVSLCPTPEQSWCRPLEDAMKAMTASSR